MGVESVQFSHLMRTQLTVPVHHFIQVPNPWIVLLVVFHTKVNIVVGRTYDSRASACPNNLAIDVEGEATFSSGGREVIPLLGAEAASWHAAGSRRARGAVVTKRLINIFAKMNPPFAKIINPLPNSCAPA
jgi:hypothetical protein